MITLDGEYWNKRYAGEDSPWDLGAVSPPLKAYFDQLTDKSLRILVPGCGNAWEAEYLWQQGFVNTHVIDLAPAALEQFQQRVPGFPAAQLIQGDFFKHEGLYDRIIEQTFFCAINPVLRPEYARKASELLAPGGKLVGLLFDDVLNTDKPPFGGNAEEYRRYFAPYFELKTLERAYNSVKPRADRELFIIFMKK